MVKYYNGHWTRVHSMGVNSCYSTIMDIGHEYTVWELTHVIVL